MASTALVKTILYKSLAEGVYKDVVTRSSSYFYFLGKTLEWADENTPALPVDSLEYEQDVRNEIITIKEIKPSDVAFVIPRRDWASDVIYDMYDDVLCDQVVGINLISGGAGYINLEDIVITISGGGGEGATAVVSEIVAGAIAGVELTNPGSGYTSVPDISITTPSGSGVEMEAVIGISANGIQKLEESKFYVVTDDYNVYKCLDNNNGAYSRNKPTGTQLEPIKTLDGYIWKFMYNIPINLRNKFYTDEYIPVVSALTNHFYSNGTIDNIFITSKGRDYSTALVSITGDGYRESDPLYITNAQVVVEGTGYTNPTIAFSPPITTASPYIATNNVNLGQNIYNPDSLDYYEVVTPGQLSTVAPTHRDGTVLNGTAALKYIGTTLKGTVTTRNDENITTITLTSAGSGYTTAPTVTINDPTGVNATAVATIGTSSISSINVTNGGSNYVAPTISVIGGGGTGALLTATLDPGTGAITAINVATGGSGYTTVPTIFIEDPTGIGASATAVLSGSAIQGIEVTNGGEGYTSPVVTITGGGGAGAEATAAVETGVIDDVILEGSIREVVIINAGSGYIEAPEITVSGGGSIVVSPVSGVDLTNPIRVTTSTAHNLVSGTFVTLKDIVGTVELNESSFYISTVTGTTFDLYSDKQLQNGIDGTSGYTAYSSGGTVQHETEGQYAVVRSKLYADRVISTHVVNPGEGYSTAPQVVFGTPWEQGLEVYTNEQFSNGNTLYTVVENGFFGSTPPTWTTGTYLTSPTWTATTLVSVGDTVQVDGERMYKALTTGYTGSTAPTHTSGTANNGEVDLEYIGKPASLRRDGVVATGYAVLRYGAGYSVTPTATITDPTGSAAEINFLTTKSEAKVSAITDNGQIVYLVIDDSGIGYTKATLTVSGDGEGASLQADLSLGAISSQQANNEILTPSGTIDAIAVISQGYSYGVANVSIEGDGTGASAEAVIDPLTNAITKINITNRGEGYTYANVKIIGNGNGAKMRAIISPYGGHGKNSPDELFSRSLMFYTNISNDLNQGVEVGNDYRQVGIIKDPRVFDGFERFQGTIGSGCYIIQSPIDDTRFFKDDELYIERTTTPEIQWEPSLPMTLGDFVWYADRIYTVVVSGVGGSSPPTSTTGSETNGFAVLTYVGSTKSKKRYRVISVDTTSALIQSLDSDIPSSNDVFIRTASITDNFTAVSVGLPDIDKFSGQLMYIDNKQGFTPSGDQTITLRTIIQF